MKTVNLNINGCLPQVRDGRDGVDGVNGKSAYDLWLANGNTGSEADFLESLKGPKGADGINGTNGEKGDKGDKGDSLFEDAKLEEGKLIITKPDGSKLEVPVPVCPDILLVDAFDTKEVGYINSVTCDKSKVEPEPKPNTNENASHINLDSFLEIVGDAAASSKVRLGSDTGSKPANIVFNLTSFGIPFDGIDSPLTVKLILKGVLNNSLQTVYEDTYMATIPAGKKSVSIPYTSHSKNEFTSKAVKEDMGGHTKYILTVENYAGKHTIMLDELTTEQYVFDKL